jgi:hypothetical protein
MRRNLSARLARLEARKAQQQASRSLVVWIGEPEPPDLRPEDRVIYLPRKARTAAEWVQACQVRNLREAEEGEPR